MSEFWETSLGWYTQETSISFLLTLRRTYLELPQMSRYPTVSFSEMDSWSKVFNSGVTFSSMETPLASYAQIVFLFIYTLINRTEHMSTSWPCPSNNNNYNHNYSSSCDLSAMRHLKWVDTKMFYYNLCQIPYDIMNTVSSSAFILKFNYLHSLITSLYCCCKSRNDLRNLI